MLLKRHLATLAFSCSALLALPAASTAHAQRGMNGLHAPGNVAISPDGSTVAWTLRSRDGSTLHLTPVAAPAPSNTPSDTDKTIAIPNATSCAYSSPIWSPDGATLAFLGACAAEGLLLVGNLLLLINFARTACCCCSEAVVLGQPQAAGGSAS